MRSSLYILWSILYGGFVTGYKGIKMALKLGYDADAFRMAEHHFGWTAAAMAPPWARLKGSFTPHDLTNLIVEWNRTNAQRGAKLMLGMALTWFMVSLVLAGVLTYG